MISPSSTATEPDRAGMLLLGLAIATAPLDIWALFRVGSHGVTATHLVAMLAWAFALLRARRMSATAAFVLYCLLVLLTWGVVSAYLQPAYVPSLARTMRNATLFVLMFGAFAGASTVRLDLTRGGAGLKIGILAYALIVPYTLYQAVARQRQWPLAYLRVTNPTYKTDMFEEGLQAGAGGAARGWGNYWMRASATFSEPSYLGQYLAYGLIASLALVALGGRHTRFGVIGVGLVTAGLIANQSLTGLLAFGVVAVVLGIPLMFQIRVGTLLRLGAAIAVMIVIALRLFPSNFQDIANRIGNLSVANSSGRFEALPVVLRMLRETPWGTGLSGVPVGQDVHNGVLLLVLQFGVIGILLPVLWAAAIVAGMVILIARRRKLSAPSRAALAASTGFLAVQLAAWFSSGEMRHTIVWVMSGVAFGTLGRMIERPLGVRALRDDPRPYSSPGLPVSTRHPLTPTSAAEATGAVRSSFHSLDVK